MADGGMSAEFFLSYPCGGTGRIVHLGDLHRRMAGKETAALRQSYGMGVDFSDVAPVLSGQTHDAVFYVELVLADNGHAAFAQQLIVVEQAAGYGVFNGHQPQAGIILFHDREELFEGVAANQFQIFTFKKLVCGNVVKRTSYSLYGYFHGLFFYSKNPAP